MKWIDQGACESGAAYGCYTKEKIVTVPQRGYCELEGRLAPFDQLFDLFLAYPDFDIAGNVNKF